MPFVDHMSIGVADPAESARFYDVILGALGARRLYRDQSFIGYGNAPSNGSFSLCRPPLARSAPAPQAGTHVCFAASSREEVQAFHRSALAAGAADNGAPGYRPEYAPDYFGAFVVDPAGNHLGAVARVAPSMSGTPRARMIDHLSIGAADLPGMARYYDALFATLFVQRLAEQPDFVMFGTELAETPLVLAAASAPGAPQEGFHVCFTARSRDEVDAFHAVGSSGGGRSNGRPGHRPEYASDYYGAFVIDPAGNHLGVVARTAAEPP